MGIFHHDSIYSVGSSPSSVIASDFDKDFNIDLVVSNRDSDNISFLSGLGNGSFQDAIPIPVGESPARLLSVDYDIDGDIDLFVPNMGSDSISVLINIDLSLWKVSSAGNDSSGDGTEEYPFATVQHAINLSENGDTVLVENGIYYENIDFTGKSIILTSQYLFSNDTNDIINTVIDGSSPMYSDSASVVRFISDEDSSSVLSGFTIRNGKGLKVLGNSYIGGGVACFGECSPLIINNNIHSNDLGDRLSCGGGISVCSGSDPFTPTTFPTIKGNRIYNNISRNGGSAIYIEGGYAKIFENVIYNNSVNNLLDWIGSIGIHKAYAIIIGNTIADNQINGIAITEAVPICTLLVKDNLIYIDTGNDELCYAVYHHGSPAVFLSFSNNLLYGGFQDYFNIIPLPGILDLNYTNYNGDTCDQYSNIYYNPHFCDPTVNDYSIYSDSKCLNASSDTSTIGALGIGCGIELGNFGIENEDSLHVISSTPKIIWGYIDYGGLPQDSFEVAVGTDDNWTYAEMWNPAPYETSDTFVIYDGSPLADGETYYIRLRVNNGYAWSEWYEISFRMNSGPLVPVPLYPILEEIVNTDQPTLWVNNSPDAEGDTLTYDFFIVVDTTYGEPDPVYVYDYPEQTDSTGWQVTEPLHENWHYWWRARAYDGYEYSDWSELFYGAVWVNVVEEAPRDFEIQYPRDTSGWYVFDMLSNFFWQASYDGDPFDSVYYTLEIAIDSDFTYVNTIDGIWQEWHTLTDSLEFGTQYWWKVKATDKTNRYTYSSNVLTFKTWKLGDANGDWKVDIFDITFLIAYLYLEGPGPGREFMGDVNGDCEINIFDITYLISYLYLDGPAPVVGCE